MWTCVYFQTQECCRRKLLLLLTISGVIGGVVLGLCLPLVQPSGDVILLVSFPGEIFMRALKMVVVPLVVTSIVSGITKFTPGSLGKIGGRLLLYYISTTVVASILGIFLASTIRPGSGNVENTEDDVHWLHASSKLGTLDAFVDVIRGMFPENIFEATFRSQRTSYQVKAKKPDMTGEIMDLTNNSLRNNTERKLRVLEYKNGTNTLGLITVSIVISIVMMKLKTRPETIMRIFCEMNAVIMRLVQLIMWCSPIGIMSLIAGKLATVSDKATVARQLGVFMATVVGGIAVHTLVTYSVLYVALTRKNPFKILRGLSQACLTAFATASSAATIPATLRCLENNLYIDPRVTRFTIPIGATVNMDATALYETVSTLFIAQIHGISLDVGQIITICCSSILASVGAAAVPGTAIVMMIMVLGSAGLPVENISLILTVDWLMGRFQAVGNIVGDSYGAAIISHFSGHEQRNTGDRVDVKRSDEPEELIDLHPVGRLMGSNTLV